MEWLYLSLFSALVWGCTSVISKEIMEDTSATLHSTIYTLLSVAFYTPVFLYYLSKLEPSFTIIALAVLALSIIGNILGFLIFNYSVEIGDLSQVMPLRRMTPIFTALIAGIALGEKLSFQTVGGIILATSGVVLVLKEKEFSYIDSLKDELHSKAIKAALLSALIYGFTSTADRFTTQLIPPELYTYFINSGMFLAFAIALNRKYEKPKTEIKQKLSEYKTLYGIIGIFTAAASLSIFKAFSAAEAAKVVTVLQIQVLIPVIAGVILFKEKNLKRKLFGSLLLLTGVLLISI